MLSHCLPRLDVINQVTCLYRLAKMYNNLPSGHGAKQQWRADLCVQPAFLQLIGELQPLVKSAAVG